MQSIAVSSLLGICRNRRRRCGDGLAESAVRKEHPAHPVAAPDAVAMLYDNTICTGCRACMPACNEANGLAPDTPCPSTRRAALGYAGRSQLQDQEHHQALQGAGRSRLRLCQAAVHALPRSCLRHRLPIRVPEEERLGRGHLEQFALHRLPLLRSGLPVRCAKVRVGQVESEDRQV